MRQNFDVCLGTYHYLANNFYFLGKESDEWYQPLHEIRGIKHHHIIKAMSVNHLDPMSYGKDNWQKFYQFIPDRTMIESGLKNVIIPWWNDNHFLISIIQQCDIPEIIEHLTKPNGDWHLQIFKSIISHNNAFSSGKVKIGDTVQIYDAQQKENYILKMTHVCI